MANEEITKQNSKQTIKRSFEGEVVSDKPSKTVVVRVDSTKVHPQYKKRYVVSKRYKVHDEKNEFKVGDIIIFEECRPKSKDKRWRAIKKIK